jgi:hypothetical protein
MRACTSPYSRPGKTLNASSVCGAQAVRRKSFITKGSKDLAEPQNDDNPRLTRAELRKVRPAGEVLPGLTGKVAAKELLSE